MITPEDWQSIQAHFNRLCNLAPPDQKADLDRLALPGPIHEQLELLLASDGGLDLDAFAGEVGRLALELDESSLVGTSVGTYRLVSLLGAGGMGDVYLAERIDGRFDARVAIKFLTAGGVRGQRLFDRERRIQARLNHPAIARMIDAGEHDRCGAYLVMEYVDGRPLNRFVEEERATPMHIIGWICRAAEAVAYAHQNLVLHRDLKPDHLMVTLDGALKVLDFGVAALLDQEPSINQATARDSFTPRYAAPEQLLGQPATTRTDVYALALILFELLAQGVNPFGNDSEQLIARKLGGRQDPLPAVPHLNRRRQTDLACIIEKGLALDPAERYAGPAAFAADLDAVCADRPIALRPPSALELCGRWLSKNRLAGTAILFAIFALLGGAATATWFGHRAQAERDAAMLEAAKAREVAAFLESIFETSSPGMDKGPDMLARDLLVGGRERIATELFEHPEIAATLELSIARSYLNLGMYDEALAVLQTDRPGIPPALDGERRLLSVRLDNLAGRYAVALQRLSGNWSMRLEPNSRAAAEVARSMARLNLGEHEPAERAAMRVMDLADDTPEGLDLKLAARTLQGAVAFDRGDYAAAQRIYSEIHRLTLERHGEISDRTGLALHNLAGLAFMAGDLEAAARSYRDAIRTYMAYFGAENRAVAMSLRSLGLTYRRLGHAADAETTLRGAMAAAENWNGRESALYQEAALQLMEVLILQDRRAEMLSLLRELPALAEGDSLNHREVACRLQRLREIFDRDKAGSDTCLEDLEVADYVNAFDRFLLARATSLRHPELLEQMRAEAIQRASALVPPDPMLVAALERLQ